MTDSIPTLTHATERDIDLLLVEELKCSHQFVKWFTSQVRSNSSQYTEIENWDVLHSVRRMRNRREIDIFLTITNIDRTIDGFLIENKLDASDQPEQAESYKDECEQLVSAGEVNAAFIVLVCPEKYAKENSEFSEKFQSVVTYENFVGFLRERVGAENGELKSRLNHRCDLIDQAIHKSRREYEAVPIPEIDNFNSQYVDLCQKRFPELIPGRSMLQSGRPGESKTMIFDPKSLSQQAYLPQIRIVHQLREGNANINFYKWGNHFDDIAASVQASLKGLPFNVAATMNRRKGGNSGLMIYGETPQIDNLKTFEDQQVQLNAGMEMVDRLRGWFEANQSTIREWAESIAELEK